MKVYLNRYSLALMYSSKSYLNIIYIRINLSLLILDTLDSSSSSESEDAHTSDLSIEDGVDEMEEVKGIMSLPTNPTENYKIGEWENHTKVINTYLLSLPSCLANNYCSI